MNNIFQKRLDQVSHKINDLGYDGFYISNLTNIRYLTGFTGSAGLLLIIEKHIICMLAQVSYLITNPL